MKKLVIALTASIAALGGVVSSAEAADAKKVCFIYVGSRTDGGWTQAHEIGREELQKHFGDKIETPFLESVPEGRMPNAPSSVWHVPAVSWSSPLRSASWMRPLRLPRNSPR